MQRTNGPGNNAGFFEDEDVQNGVPGTIVTADWLNAVQEEILEVIEAAGITPKGFDKTDPDSYTQLLQALRGQYVRHDTAAQDLSPTQQANARANLLASGLNVIKITQSTVWTNPYPYPLTLLMTLVGGGGGGGGAGIDLAGRRVCGGGGGSGEVVWRQPVVVPAGASYNCTIGAGGVRGATEFTPANKGFPPGGNGGITMFGAVYAADGGAGGDGGFSAVGSVGGAGGWSRFQRGGAGQWGDSPTLLGGAGGATPFGGGGAAVYGYTSLQQPGYGGGGTGAAIYYLPGHVNLDGSLTRPEQGGSNGSPGLIILEY